MRQPMTSIVRFNSQFSELILFELSSFKPADHFQILLQWLKRAHLSLPFFFHWLFLFPPHCWFFLICLTFKVWKLQGLVPRSFLFTFTLLMKLPSFVASNYHLKCQGMPNFLSTVQIFLLVTLELYNQLLTCQFHLNVKQTPQIWLKPNLIFPCPGFSILVNGNCNYTSIYSNTEAKSIRIILNLFFPSYPPNGQ